MDRTTQWTKRLERLQRLPPLEALPADALLPADLVAVYLDISPKTLANDRSANRGLPFLKVGRAVRYRVGAVRNLREVRP